MILRRLATDVRRIAEPDLLTTIVAGDPRLRDYESDVSPHIGIDALVEALEPFRGHPLVPGDDARIAAALKSALALDPRTASDKTIWWWVTIALFPDIARARWATDGKAPTPERMLGTINRNTFARLWWGAELVRGDRTRLNLLFGNQDIFEAVIGRRLGRDPGVLRVILDRLGPRNGTKGRETIRDLQQVLSTLVLESIDGDKLGTLIDDLWNRRHGTE